jgi:hypothetical protein
MGLVWRVDGSSIPNLTMLLLRSLLMLLPQPGELMSFPSVPVFVFSIIHPSSSKALLSSYCPLKRNLPSILSIAFLSSIVDPPSQWTLLLQSSLSTLSNLFAFVAWLALNGRCVKSAVFSIALPTEQILVDTLLTTCLSFCPSLFEVMQAADPPPISFFQGLPTNVEGKWAVYAIVLQKQDAMDLVYIGSGTDSKGGVRVRFKFYDNKTRASMPYYVQHARIWLYHCQQKPSALDTDPVG